MFHGSGSNDVMLFKNGKNMKFTSVNEKRNILKYSGKIIPTSLNYCDLLLNLNNNDLGKFKLFKIENGKEFCLGGFSEIGPAFNRLSQKL